MISLAFRHSLSAMLAVSMITAVPTWGMASTRSADSRALWNLSFADLNGCAAGPSLRSIPRGSDPYVISGTYLSRRPGDVAKAEKSEPVRKILAWPAWRRNLPPGQFTPIVNTGNLDRTSANHATIDAWNGLAAGPTTWWSLANGGHEDSSENKVIAIDFADDAPTWKVIHPGSLPAAVPPKINLLYYYDGLPASSHSYYTSQYIGARNRVMRFGTGIVWGNGNGNGPNVDGFRISDRQWDSPRTWPDVPIRFTSAVSTVAKNPVTEDVYVANNGSFAKWTQATNSWSDFNPSRRVQWQYHGSVIDAARNRWVYASETKILGLIDLSTGAYSTLPLTGVEGDARFSDYDAIVHDSDNDRYLLMTDTRVYAIDPNNGAATRIATVAAAKAGPLSRFAYFHELGGVAYLPDYASNVQFMPTRSAVQPADTVTSPSEVAVEYYHSAFGHYFITASRNEVEVLDDELSSTWERTGQSFKVNPLDSPGTSNVCRFFSVGFSPASSHFFSPLAFECAAVSGNADWQFEGLVFSMGLPDLAGACPEDHVPLYRLYNNGMGGAPNHRYTTSQEIRTAMLNVGWVSEGVGVDGVIGCVPR